jgi:phage baseplate assembly protein W
MARTRGEGEQRGQAESGKIATSFRIKPETRAGLDGLQKAWGMSQNAIIDRLVGDAVQEQERADVAGRLERIEARLTQIEVKISAK